MMPEIAPEIAPKMQAAKAWPHAAATGDSNAGPQMKDAGLRIHSTKTNIMR
jgi:hypothetical protein